MELKNQPIYKGVHKTLCINFRACAAFCPKPLSTEVFWTGMISFRGWQSVDINSLKCFGPVCLKDS